MIYRSKYYQTNYLSPIGEITLGSDGENLIGLWFVGQKFYCAQFCDNAEENHELKVFQDTKLWLDRYFLGKKPSISELPLAPIGNDFMQKVWALLREIPYGEVKTYGEIARQMGKKMSAQAVGGAVGHNPISIIIPCHRVVGANGKLTGYAGGLDIKRKLLQLENAQLPNL